MKILLSIQHLLLVLIGIAWSSTTSAMSFYALNEDEVSIHYVTTNANEVSVASGNYSGRVVIPSSVDYEGTTYAVTGIQMLAFSSKPALTSVVIPASVYEIGEQAFLGCESLNEVMIHANLSYIPSMCFSNCAALKSISLPSSVKMIQSSAFSNCGLTEVYLSPFLESIGQRAFHGCSSLRSITLPGFVNSIGDFAFSNCTNLSIVKSEIKTPFALNNVFSFISADATLYVPAGTKAAYESTAGWNFSNIVEMEDVAIPSMSVNDVTLWPNQNGEISISLQNGETQIIALQFDLALPEGINRSSYDDGYGGHIQRDRCLDYTGRIETESTDGTITVVLYSESNHAIVGSEGAVLNLLLKADASLHAGSYQGKLTNITLVKEDNTKIYPEDAAFTIVVKGIQKGDCNGDGSVDVQDITEIAKYIVHQASEIDWEAADMDEDNIIDVADITLVVKAIMEAKPNESQIMGGTVNTSDNLSLVNMGNGRYAINLTNDNAYVASQFDIKLHEGSTIALEKSSRCQNHLLHYERIAEDTYRVVIYSLNNETYTGNDGTLLTMTTGEADEGVALENALFVNEGNHKAFFGTVPVANGIQTVNVEKAKDSIYTIDGRKVTSDMLTKGLFIVNGKIVLVR